MTGGGNRGRSAPGTVADDANDNPNVVMSEHARHAAVLVVPLRAARLGAARAAVGITLIELITVFAIMAILATVSVPSILRVSARSRLSSDAECIVRAHRQARHLALISTPPPVAVGVPVPHYGVALRHPDGGPAEVVVLYGTTADDALCADDGGAPGRVIHRWQLNRMTRIRYATTSPPPATLEQLDGGTQLYWFYRYGQGSPISVNEPIVAAPTIRPQDVGVAAQAARPARFMKTAMGDANWRKSGEEAQFRRELVSMPLPALPASPISALAVGSGRMSAAVAIYSAGQAQVGEVR